MTQCPYINIPLECSVPDCAPTSCIQTLKQMKIAGRCLVPNIEKNVDGEYPSCVQKEPKSSKLEEQKCKYCNSWEGANGRSRNKSNLGDSSTVNTGSNPKC